MRDRDLKISAWAIRIDIGRIVFTESILEISTQEGCGGAVTEFSPDRFINVVI